VTVAPSHRMVQVELIITRSKWIKKLLRTTLVWRASGLAYPTAIVATKGSFMDPSAYFELCRKENAEVLSRYLVDGQTTVLEFGSGLGGNLISISPRIARGVGIDVNRGYVRIARLLARHSRASNLDFLCYDGVHLPQLGRFDIALCLNVFERLPRLDVARYVRWMQTQLAPHGILIAFFLHEGAVRTGFADRLGEDAYVFWTLEQAEKVLNQSGFRVLDTVDWLEKGHLVIGAASCPSAAGVGN
jgi:SAM-dependent methyltransferase